ncbi:hypothetical protein [Desulforhopalus sp. IMCC35007]|uniref:hypothetical protein n=1 Tax=Desulforhopalus sp. IMCC35007 TaxID=2569543 RepID=UPI0010AE3F4B|nr:hypothetical protein [Desulforhopalus sp. IMCC35007]TKB08136.1 hypothetical protein FCL48_14230 [Desulforhopalus sp. IMCC35007]
MLKPVFSLKTGSAELGKIDTCQLERAVEKYGSELQGWSGGKPDSRVIGGELYRKGAVESNYLSRAVKIG